MSLWGYLDLENERGEAPDMMENISVENDVFRLRCISLEGVPYASKNNRGAPSWPPDMFLMTLVLLKVGTFVVEHVMLRGCSA